MFLMTSWLAAAPHTAERILPEQKTALQQLVQAEVFFPIALAIIGVLLLLFGFKAYKAIVVFNCVALGFWVGHLVGSTAQIASVAAIIGAVVMGAVSWPLMKYGVAVCGGVVGAVIGMVVWRYCNYHPDYAWAGGLCGLIFLGMLSFMLFKTSIILFTCVQGAAMLVLGVSALLIRWTPWDKDLLANLNGKPILMPLLVGAIALLGLIWQQQKHGLLGHEGGGGGGGGGSAKPEAKK